MQGIQIYGSIKSRRISTGKANVLTKLCSYLIYEVPMEEGKQFGCFGLVVVGLWFNSIHCQYLEKKSKSKKFIQQDSP